MVELHPRQVTINDHTWSPRLQVNASRALEHQWEQLEASGCIENFRIAAGRSDRLREGWFFADSDAYKWLDAAARVFLTHPTPALDRRMDEFVGLLAAAQSADGYLFTYNQVHFPGVRWVNLQIEHELYCHGHLIEAGVSHFEATGRTSMLTVARRAADLIVRDFLHAGPLQTCGHEEIELALIRLHGVTGHSPYLDLAGAFVERRGRARGFALHIVRQQRSTEARGRTVRAQREAYLAAHPDYQPHRVPPGNPAVEPPGVRNRWMVSAVTGKYFQQHAPIRQLTTPVGHAVRFGYLETAAAMLLRVGRGDAGLLAALEAAWERMVERRMYVTGGLGSLPALEGFGRDFELDPEVAYAETCAALACIFWNWEMALLTRRAKYSDLLEWQLYNAAGVGMSLAGDTYLYNNPLVSRGNVRRLPWYAVPCCPSNLSRTWAGLGKYIYSADDLTAPVPALYVHQFIGSRATVDLGGPVDVSLASGLPWHGEADLRVSPERARPLAVHLRVPSWSQGEIAVSVNGTPVPAGELAHTAAERQVTAAAGGFDPRLASWLTLRRTWSPGDAVQLRFNMPVIARRAPRIRKHEGKVALTRGPLAYCLESVDTPNLFDAAVDPSSLRPTLRPDLLGGIMALEGPGLTAIPYALWGNRGPSQMTVWMTEQASHSP